MKPKLSLHIRLLVVPPEVIHEVNARVSHDAFACPQVHVSESYVSCVETPPLLRVLIQHGAQRQLARGASPGQPIRGFRSPNSNFRVKSCMISSAARFEMGQGGSGRGRELRVDITRYTENYIIDCQHQRSAFAGYRG